MSALCPCCSQDAWARVDKTAFKLCGVCGHCMSTSEPVLVAYSYQKDRNETENKKFTERKNFILNSISKKEKILEFGCAEGYLGKILKHENSIVYHGVEISQDGKKASTFLDSVFTSAEKLTPKDYDLILAFHVLEHLQDVRKNLIQWKTLLKEEGRIVIEVPNRAGHPFLYVDTNQEHIHQFSVSSLSCLLNQLGYDIITVETLKFESSAYPDSIRVLAKIALSRNEKQLKILRNLSLNDEKFLIWGIGGDFEKFILPVLTQLSVSALIDTDKKKHGRHFENFTIRPFEPVGDHNKKILITSVKYAGEIKQQLILQGVPESHIVFLGDILTTEPGDA